MSIQASYTGGGGRSSVFQNKSGKTIAPQGTTPEPRLLPFPSAGFRKGLAFPVPSCWDLGLPCFFHQPGSIPTL